MANLGNKNLQLKSTPATTQIKVLIQLSKTI